MKLTADNTQFEGCLPENRVPVTIQSTQQLFGILSDSIYSNKILAVIRELSCNAYDSHIAACNLDKFTVNLPTDLNPVFSVSDMGTGIHPDKMGDIFWTYGKSTKTETNTQIGALGLGAKSPFAYTKSSYIVKNRWNGIEYTYVCFIGDQGIPNATVLDESATNEPNGITVELAVTAHDVRAFKRQAEEFFSWWDECKRPRFNIELNIPKFISTDKFRGNKWAFSHVNNGTSYVVMGNIAYTINKHYIQNISDELSQMLNLNIIMFADIGDVDFQPSRESLAFSEKTIKYLENFSSIFWNEVRAHFKKEIDEIMQSTPVVAYQKMQLLNNKCKHTLGYGIKHGVFGNINYEYNGVAIDITASSYDIELFTKGYSKIVFRLYENYYNEKTNSYGMMTSITKVETKYNRSYIWQKPSIDNPFIPHSKISRLYKSITKTDSNGNVTVTDSIEKTEFELPSFSITTEKQVANSPIVFYVNDLIKESPSVINQLFKHAKANNKQFHVLVALGDKEFIKDYPDYGFNFVNDLIKGTVFEGCEIVLLSSIIKEEEKPQAIKKPRNKKNNLELSVLNFKMNSEADQIFIETGAYIDKQRFQVDEYTGYYIPYYNTIAEDNHYSKETINALLSYAAELNLVPEFVDNGFQQIVLLNKTSIEDLTKRGFKMVNFVEHLIERTKSIITKDFVIYDVFVSKFTASFAHAYERVFEQFIKTGKVDNNKPPFRYFKDNNKADDNYHAKHTLSLIIGRNKFIEEQELNRLVNEIHDFFNNNPCLYGLVYAINYSHISSNMEKAMLSEMIDIVLKYKDVV